MKKNHELGKHTTMFRDQEYVVYPEVYSPKIFTSTSFFCDKIPKMGGTIIEVGSGCGALVLACVLEGKFDFGIGTDIYPPTA